MAVPLLSTKLNRPQYRPGLVPRPRLVDRLDEGLCLGRRLTVISAPAGFGKTTLLGDWLRSGVGGAGRPRSVWISLDDGDNEPASFFSYLVAALQKVNDKIGESLRELLEAPQLPPVEALVANLINDIAALPLADPNSGPAFVVVLDDYHAIQSTDIHNAIMLLLDRQPSQMHLAIATRHDPPLLLSRLRARDQLTEIREDDLALTPQEIQAFLRAMDLELAAAEIAILAERTEGWVAGLQLAGLSLKGRDASARSRIIAGFSGRHQFILDYLMDEVLRNQPEEIQSFLLQTSVLERMCAPLCDAILESDTESLEKLGHAGESSPDSGLPSFSARRVSPTQETLEILDRSNLFVVPLDEDRSWYRYHHLFGDLLRAWLQQAQPSLVPELHRRAATWFEEQSLASEAVHHALETKDSDLAANLIERLVQRRATWSWVEAPTLLKWLAALPDEALEARPALQLFAARALYSTGQWQDAETSMRALEAWLEDHPDLPESSSLWERLKADQASYAAMRGQVQQAIDYAEQSQSRLPVDDELGQLRVQSTLGMAYVRAGDVTRAALAFSTIVDALLANGPAFMAVPLVCNQADVQIMQGQLRQATQTCERAIDLGTVDGKQGAPAGFARLELGTILFEQNQLAAAESQVTEGLELLRQGGISLAYGMGYALLSLIRQARNDVPGALSAVQRANQLAEGTGIPRLVMLASAYQARIWLACGEMDQAKAWALEYDEAGPVEYLRDFESLTLARIYLATGRSSEALHLIEALQTKAEEDGRQGSVIEALALRAVALRTLSPWQLGEAPDEALICLERTLKLAEPEGYVRAFAALGESMELLLRQAIASQLAAVQAQQLLSEFGSQAPSEQTRPVPSRAPDQDPSPLIEPLSKRELEVLRLLAEGLTNAEIGQRLYISLPTVKSHTRNIYGKLGVHSRRQAVSQANSLGILP